MRKIGNRLISIVLTIVFFVGSLSIALAESTTSNQSLPVIIQEAVDLGIVDASLSSRLSDIATQPEVAQMVKNVDDLVFGKDHSEFLIDMLDRYESSTRPASRYWFAQAVYNSYYVERMKIDYPGYDALLDISGSDFPGELWPDASVINQNLGDGSIGEGALFSFCTDAYAITGDTTVGPVTGTWREDWDSWNGPAICGVLFDRTTGEKVLPLDKGRAFNPATKMTLEDAISASLRYYHYYEKPAVDVAYSDVESYDHTIITDELLNRASNLPNATCQSLPSQWHGILWSTMGYVTTGALSCDTDKVATPGDIRIIKDAGLNFLGLSVSFSRLQGPDFISGTVNETRLKELDQIIAWCMEQDIHVDLRGWEIQGFKDSDEFNKCREKQEKSLTNKGVMAEFAQFWGMLARRYAGISNRDLSFNLLVEPSYKNDKAYVKYMKPVIDAIREATPDRVIIADIHASGLKGEGLAKLGVALSYHQYDPRSFCVLNDMRVQEKDIIDDRNYLQSVVWPYQTADGEIYDAKACMDIPLSGEKRSVSLDDVRNTAVKYNVGFMVGEFGIFGEHAGYIGRYRYTDETLFGYLQDMTTVFKENDLPWCYGAFLGNTGLVLTYPAVIGVKYDKTDSSVYYVDIGMRDFFQSTVQ